jgi:NUMOD3 motif
LLIPFRQHHQKFEQKMPATRKKSHNAKSYSNEAIDGTSSSDEEWEAAGDESSYSSQDKKPRSMRPRLRDSMTPKSKLSERANGRLQKALHPASEPQPEPIKPESNGPTTKKARQTREKRKNSAPLSLEGTVEESRIPSIARLTAQGGYAHLAATKEKISAANRGAIPWNKGRNRSADDKAKIAMGVRARNRTILLARLKEMGMTEEAWLDKKKELNHLRGRNYQLRKKRIQIFEVREKERNSNAANKEKKRKREEESKRADEEQRVSSSSFRNLLITRSLVADLPAIFCDTEYS